MVRNASWLQDQHYVGTTESFSAYLLRPTAPLVCLPLRLINTSFRSYHICIIVHKSYTIAGNLALLRIDLSELRLLHYIRKHVQFSRDEDSPAQSRTGQCFAAKNRWLVWQWEHKEGERQWCRWRRHRFRQPIRKRTVGCAKSPTIMDEASAAPEPSA
jgi:hypothetical protein